MNWKDLSKTVGAAAPVIGGLLGGPVGAAAGSLLAKGLGVPETPDDVARVLQGDPEAMVKVREIESNERVRLAELSTQATTARYLSDAGDRDSARRRQETLRDLTPTLLAGLVITITAFLEGWVLIRGMPVNVDGAIAGRILGTLDAMSLATVNYFFGSSASSERKTELLAKTTGSMP